MIMPTRAKFLAAGIRMAKIALVAVAFLGVCSGLLVYGLPPLLTWQLPSFVNQRTGLNLSISTIKIGLFPLALQMDGVALNDQHGAALASFNTLLIQIDAWQSLTHQSLLIDNVNLDQPSVHLVRHVNGALNVNALLPDNTQAQTEESAHLPFTLAKMRLSAGQLSWRDESQPTLSETISLIQLELDNLTTQANKPAHLMIDMRLASGSRLSSTTQLSLEPFEIQGQFAWNDLTLNKLPIANLPALQANIAINSDFKLNNQPKQLTLELAPLKLKIDKLAYQTDTTTLKVDELSQSAHWQLEYANDTWQWHADPLHLEGHRLDLSYQQWHTQAAELALTTALTGRWADGRLQLQTKQGELTGKQTKIIANDEPLVAVAQWAAKQISFDLNKHTLNTALLNIDAAEVKTLLDAQGRCNFQNLSRTTNQTPAATLNTQATPWLFTIDHIALNHAVLQFADQSVPQPLALSIKPIDFHIEQVSNAPNAKLPFKLTATIADHGQLKAEGQASLSPLALNMGINVNDVDLTDYQGYFDRYLRLDLIDGLLDVDGQLALAFEPFNLKFTGNTQISHFLTRDRRVHRDFVTWKNLSLNQLDIDWPAQRYLAEALILDQPYARVTIRKDKTINFSGLLVERDDKQTGLPTTENQTGAYFKLGKIQINNGSSDFTDLSLILPFSAHVQGLNGGANDLSSDKNASFSVALKGNAYDLAPVDVTGKLSPYLGQYAVKVDFKGLPMPLISPYMVQFAGYKVEKGKLSLALDYHIVDRKLTASNDLVIDQFELGEKIDNPEAVPLPMKLAVALLKDDQGRIQFNVPITGSLENPQFSLRAVIREALFNALNKIISSPFTALASLFDGGKDLSIIEFAPGNESLNTEQQTKLNDMAKALRERPQLALEIKGISGQTLDWPAIRDEALEDQLKIRRADEINQHNAIKIRPEYVQLTQESYQRLLKTMFTEKFPLLAEAQPKTNFYETAKQKLLEVIRPEEERLKDLAAHRAQAIAKFIVKQGGIAQERVYILDPEVKAETMTPEKAVASLLFLVAE